MWAFWLWTLLGSLYFLTWQRCFGRPIKRRSISTAEFVWKCLFNGRPWYCFVNWRFYTTISFNIVNLTRQDERRKNESEGQKPKYPGFCAFKVILSVLISCSHVLTYTAKVFYEFQHVTELLSDDGICFKMITMTSTFPSSFFLSFYYNCLKFWIDETWWHILLYSITIRLKTVKISLKKQIISGFSKCPRITPKMSYLLFLHSNGYSFPILCCISRNQEI